MKIVQLYHKLLANRLCLSAHSCALKNITYACSNSRWSGIKVRYSVKGYCMKKVTINQSHAIMAALATNVDWTVLDGDLLQGSVITNAKEAGKQFTAFLAGGAVMASRWRERDGVIYFSVTSNGMTGPQWIERLEKKGIKLSKWAKDVLNSPDFKPTNGATTEVAVLKGMLFEDNDRVTSKIRAEAGKRKLVNPNAELGCLVRDMFTDEEIEAMGLVWIVTMHKPIKDSGGDAVLLGAGRRDAGPWLNAYCGEPDIRWSRDSGFAFAVSQVSS